MGTKTEIPSVTHAGVEQHVFTREQIAKLELLQEVYPFPEWTDNGKQWERLVFLKWRHEHGDLQGSNQPDQNTGISSSPLPEHSPVLRPTVMKPGQAYHIPKA